MAIEFEQLNWQEQSKGKISSRFIDYGLHINHNEKLTAYQERTHIDDGFLLVRQILNTNVPLNYPEMINDDYIGLCYTFCDAKADTSQAAFPHLFHDKMNVTNGYDYDASTHNLLHHDTYYISLRFSKEYLDKVHQIESLPNWLMHLVDSEYGQLDTVNMPADIRNLAWQLFQFPKIFQLSFSDSLSMQADTLNWFARLINTETNQQADSKLESICLKDNHKINPSVLSGTSIHKACQIIERRFNQSINATDIANILGTNDCYLKKAFRDKTGKSIHQYLTDYRLEQACLLLRDRPNLSINHIASVCGYQSSHFSQVFKKKMGMSPKEYRFEGILI